MFFNKPTFKVLLLLILHYSKLQSTLHRYLSIIYRRHQKKNKYKKNKPIPKTRNWFIKVLIREALCKKRFTLPSTPSW
jgi:hypothetical protein